MRKRFTIEDVAKLAGVGKVTVSYVLNGRATEARISPETCERVFSAAKELDYRPNAIARSLASKRTNAITLVFQHGEYFSAGSSFINEAMRGVCEACVEADINLILHTRNFSSPVEEAHALMDGRSDGTLILRDDKDPLITELVKRGFPVMLFFTRHTDPNIDFIDADNFTGGRTATQHLLDLGHKRIAMAVGPSGSVASNDRKAGYLAALSSAEIDPSNELTKTYRTPSEVDHSLVDWVKEIDATALLCWSDDVAFSCMSTLKQAGFNLPDDLSIVGFDSSDACENVHPTLTSVRQPVYEMGYAAARRLIAKTRQVQVLGDPSIYPLSLDIRNSTQPNSTTSPMKRIL
jgi:LacI family transcriptional regulator